LTCWADPNIDAEAFMFSAFYQTDEFHSSLKVDKSFSFQNVRITVLEPRPDATVTAELDFPLSFALSGVQNNSSPIKIGVTASNINTITQTPDAIFPITQICSDANGTGLICHVPITIPKQTISNFIFVAVELTWKNHSLSRTTATYYVK
jgi:hypothetical protein